jgi:hypothetical protein
MANSLTREFLRSVFDYNSETGDLVWKKNRGNNKVKGKIAGYTNKDGYILIRVNDKLHYAHRLVWFWVMGEWPKNQIDHINRIRNDNRWVNLRSATPSQNKQNTVARKDNKLGIKGVFWCKRSKKYKVKITVNKKYIHLGYYSNLEEAIKIRKKAEKEYFGEFA